MSTFTEKVNETFKQRTEPTQPEDSYKLTGFCNPRTKGMSDEDKKKNPISWVAKVVGVETVEEEERPQITYIEADFVQWMGEYVKGTPSPCVKTWFLLPGEIYKCCVVDKKGDKPVYSFCRIENKDVVLMDEEQVISVFREQAESAS